MTKSGGESVLLRVTLSTVNQSLAKSEVPSLVLRNTTFEQPHGQGRIMTSGSIFEKWYPVTSDFGLIEASAEAVCETYASWWNEIGKEVSIEDCKGTLDEQLSALLPLTIGKNRALILPTTTSWTAFFRNGIQGSDPASAMPELAKRMGRRAMRICISEAPKKYPAAIWELYDPESGDTRRSLAAANDGGRWVFETYGEPFEFEAVERYKMSRKRDRFDKFLLFEYVSHFGVPKIGDEMFVSGPPGGGWLVNFPNWDHFETFTLEEVSAGAPWQK